MRTLFLTDEDVRAVSDWAAAIDTLQRAYATNIDPLSVPARSMARAPGIWLRSLTAISPLGGHLGCKLIAASYEARRASYLIALFDKDSMELRALIDGNQVTGIRTAATAAVAIDALSPRRPLRVAVLGSGFEARAQLTALATDREIASATVYSPTPANREKFASHFDGILGVRVRTTNTPQDALVGADVTICAARAKNESPVLFGDWLEPGMTVVSVGSTLPEQREVDVSAIDRAQLIIADAPDEVAHGSGDLLAAASANIDFSAKLVSLNDVISRRRVARSSAEDIVLYKSVGSALQDVVVAEMLLARARARGIGTLMPVSVVPVIK